MKKKKLNDSIHDFKSSITTINDSSSDDNVSENFDLTGPPLFKKRGRGRPSRKEQRQRARKI